MRDGFTIFGLVAGEHEQVVLMSKELWLRSRVYNLRNAIGLDRHIMVGIPPGGDLNLGGRDYTPGVWSRDGSESYGWGEKE